MKIVVTNRGTHDVTMGTRGDPSEHAVAIVPTETARWGWPTNAVALRSDAPMNVIVENASPRTVRVRPEGATFLGSDGVTIGPWKVAEYAGPSAIVEELTEEPVDVYKGA